MLDRLRRITGLEGQPGPMDRDPRRETPELLLDDDHHAVLVGWIEPPLGIDQVLLDSLGFSGGEQRPGEPVAQHGLSLQLRVGEHLEPSPELGFLPVPAKGGHDQLHQIRGPLEGLGDHRVPDGFPVIPVRGVPLTGALMKTLDEIWRLLG